MSILLKEILDKIEFERLIEEGKDPVELLHYKFQNVPTEIIDKVIEVDPTKKKTYSQWLLNKWDDEENTIVNNLRNGRIAKLFQHYKEHNDIQIKDCPSVKQGLDMFVPEEDTVLLKSSAPTSVLMNNGWIEEVPSELANDFEIVFNKDNWVIAVPNTYEADCKLGENMKWCTAGGRTDFEGGRSYYDNYLDDYGGKYYVNFDMSKGENRLGKDYPFTRYQFHFETKQFMDKEDDPVELSDIDIPESAMEFYEDEGYSSDEFMNLEEKMERYEQERWNVGYQINDDLYLNIAYDEDFEFIEPNDETDYYVFSVNDDRDPICWEEISNPYSVDIKNIILVNKPNFVVLKKKYREDDGVLVFSTGKWGDWNDTLLEQYIFLPNNLGIFGVDGQNYFTVISSNIDKSYNKMKADSCEDIFVNEQCTNVYNAEHKNNIFVEAVSEGYHSLFNISSTAGNELVCVVSKDIPANGKYFTINEQGLVEGEFRSYRVYNDEYYGGQDSNLQYNFEDKLGTGDYLISVPLDFGKKYNILKKGSNQPLIDPWFNEYIAFSKNLYGVKNNGEIGFFTIESGQQVGRWYDRYRGIDQEKDILYGKVGDKKIDSKEQFDIVSGYEKKVIGTFDAIISTKAANNKIIVQSIDDSNTKIFDYVEHKFCFPELNGFSGISSYDHPYLFSCNVANTEEKALFDLASERVLARGIKSFEWFKNPNTISYASNKYIKLIKLNDKCNLFDVNKQVEIFQNDVDDVTSINEYINIIIYCINGKYYPLNYKTGNIVINPNGIRIPTFVNNRFIYCSGENYNICFDENGEFDRWQHKVNYFDWGENFNRDSTPQEVLNMYSLIFGQQESIMRNFNNYVRRINEAIKR